MSTFEQTRGMRTQEHFEILEIDLPVITGTCTIDGEHGYGTPLTCDQQWSGEYKTYKFTNTNAPLISGSPYRCIKSISETATSLKPGDGLASRGSLNITLIDFDKQDPNMDAPAVNETVKNQGTFFGKLAARQVFENKNVRLKLYRVEQDGSIDLVNGAQTRHYVTESITADNKGSWKLACKDVLSLANLDEKTWPIPTNSFLRQDAPEANTVIQVDNETDYTNAEVIRIGDEFMRVTGIDTSDAADTKLQVTRGQKIVGLISGETLTTTSADEHSAGDEVFICEVSDNETIDSLIARILIDSDFDPALIPTADWAAEIAQWHAQTRINTLHIESESVNDVLKKILNGFLMDLWFSTTDNEAKLSAISVWKQSTAQIKEGRDINAHSLNKKPNESLRASRALVVYDKRNLADDDGVSSFKKASQFSDNTIIGPELFGKHKDKTFENNAMIDKTAADLLVQRYVSRFKFTPFTRTFTADERYINYNVGDVVDIESEIDQGFDGTSTANLRAQITKINPTYKNTGRSYKVEAMTYEAAFEDGTEIVLDAPLSEVNLHVLAGAPSQAVTITFVLTSYSQGQTAIRAGSFAANSKIILILANGFEGKANGGDGGRGAEYFFEGGDIISGTPSNGESGGAVYDAQGVDTDVYFSGSTPSIAYPDADGYIYAPNGGDGGFLFAGSGRAGVSGNGGNGGNGRLPGQGGRAGPANLNDGIAGANGQIDSASWGQAGSDNDATGGSAGSGVIDSGAIVQFFGDDSNRYVNGNGDH